MFVTPLFRWRGQKDNSLTIIAADSKESHKTKIWSVPGSNWRPSACKADVITTTPTDQHGGQRQNYEKYLAERGFDPRTSGLWAQHASTAPLCYLQHGSATGLWKAPVKQNMTKKYKSCCQKWDSNPRPQKWTATWTQRLRPLGHPDSYHMK